MVMTSRGSLPPSGRAIHTPSGVAGFKSEMAEIKSESVADFIPESVAGLLRNQQHWREVPSAALENAHLRHPFGRVCRRPGPQQARERAELYFDRHPGLVRPIIHHAHRRVLARDLLS